MNAALKEILLQKCRKKVKSVESYDRKEGEDESEEESEDLHETDSSQELPFDDILAEKRRNYSPKEEFIFLLYNDLLQLFVKEWDGKFLRKEVRKRNPVRSKDFSEGEESSNETQDHEPITLDSSIGSKEYIKDTSESRSNLFWKVTTPDEFASIKFISNNTYSGRISRKMMEGKGVYRWSNGAQYKGDFERNQIHGKGLLEWNSNCWYEGDFANNYRHGRGIMVIGENRYMYTGQWYMGQRHGKGYCRYGDNGTYDGDWVMGKMDGVGLRTYATGSCYFGRWKNGLHHGTGTMVWTNGDVYRGEWKCGAMHGHGEYIWNGFYNKTLTWPRESSYVGQWLNGKRCGEGELKLNTVGGAKYFGYWKDNKKHGYGVIIGSNGEKFESNPLFLNDVMCTSGIENSNSIDETESKDEVECVRVIKEVKPKFIEKPEQLQVAFITPIMKPEQFPSLSYYLTRLLDPKSLEEHVSSSVSSGKCYNCENESCTCLAVNSIDYNENEDKETSDLDSITKNAMDSNWKYEEHWAHNLLTLHMARLHQIYNIYAQLFAASPPTCNLVMSRLCLWQLWRDCGIHKKGLSLIEIDNCIAQNKAALIKDPHDPFEKIEIWQFLHTLLEISWHLYTKYDDVEADEINGKLAGGLHKFLKNDIYPHARNYIENLRLEYQHLLPICSVFELYKQIGYPFSTKDLLRAMCASNTFTHLHKFDTTDSQYSVMDKEILETFSNGINCVPIGGRINYLLKRDEILMQPYPIIDIPKNNENDESKGLQMFRNLGTSKVLKIISLICPAIKDMNTDTIVNIDYELTFLEFYEIIIEATKQLFCLKEETEKKLQTVQNDADLEKKETLRSVKRSSIRRSSRTKSRI